MPVSTSFYFYFSGIQAVYTDFGYIADVTSIMEQNSDILKLKTNISDIQMESLNVILVIFERFSLSEISRLKKFVFKSDCIFSDDYALECFDSDGRSPDGYSVYLRQFMGKFYRIKVYKKRLQSNDTAVCGQYCLVYLMCRTRGYSMTK